MMYKHIFLGLALAATLTACDKDDFQDWAKPQQNSTEAAQSIKMTLTPVETISFDNLPAGTEAVKLFTAAFEAAQAPKATYTVTLTRPDGVGTPQVLEANDTCAVALDKFQTAVETLYGKASEVRTLNAAVVAHAVVGDQAFQYSGTCEVKAQLAKKAYVEYIYVPGNHQGWAPGTAPALHSPDLDGVYTGFSMLNGSFKFTQARDWSAAQYNFTDFTTFDGIQTTTDGDQNLYSTANGLHYITVDVAKQSVKATLLSTVGVIGDFNSWATDVPLTYNATDDCYEGDVTLDGGAFKFRFDGKWDIDLGGSFDNLSVKGANLKQPAGTYAVKLYLSRSKSDKIYCTMTKK